MKVSEAEEITGGLSKPSKMPGPAYSLPAKDCKMGSVLAKIPGTTCHGCYALKGRYNFPNVQNALAKRLKAIAHPKWKEAMIVLIKASKTKWFRWHDSGDIQSIEHLTLISDIAKGLPDVKFWLPTREYKIVQEFTQRCEVPSNLTIRLSAHKIDEAPPSGYGLVTSTVHTKGFAIIGTECEAYKRENKCGPCRACWDKRVKNVSYHKH